VAVSEPVPATVESMETLIGTGERRALKVSPLCAARRDVNNKNAATGSNANAGCISRLVTFMGPNFTPGGQEISDLKYEISDLIL